jgi:predicted Zn-dependent protease
MLALRMFEGARARLDALLAAQPMNVAAVRLRARVEVDAGRAPEAEAVLAAARQRGVPGL